MIFILKTRYSNVNIILLLIIISLIIINDIQGMNIFIIVILFGLVITIYKNMDIHNNFLCELKNKYNINIKDYKLINPFQYIYNRSYECKSENSEDKQPKKIPTQVPKIPTQVPKI